MIMPVEELLLQLGAQYGFAGVTVAVLVKLFFRLADVIDRNSTNLANNTTAIQEFKDYLRRNGTR